MSYLMNICNNKMTLYNNSNKHQVIIKQMISPPSAQFLALFLLSFFVVPIKL